MQIGAAFASVQISLAFFITFYRDLADWRSVIARLDGFNNATTDTIAAASSSGLKFVTGASKSSLSIDNLSIDLPNGANLLVSENFIIDPGERALLTGRTGSGKSTFFRAVAGIWPFGSGTIVMPQNANLIVLPQRPYIPVGNLEEAIIYPLDRSTFELAHVAEVLEAVGLPTLATRFAEEAHWDRILSLGEQQCLSIARAILHAPDYLLLDEATASLDKLAEAKLYRLLRERLPRTAIVSIAHGSTLEVHHERHFAVCIEGNRHNLRDRGQG